MDFNIEKKISNFIESQFPQFYLEEGQNFVEFVKAYYEWMESEGQATLQSRSLLDYRDIDNTTTAFLEFFQKKYLYGIPFNTIVDKKLLLKHILDVYRSKGSIQCYKLLFKLIYNQDVDVYLPGNDVLRVSDGTWVQPKYIEVSNIDDLEMFVGKEIYGVSSKTRAVVESYCKEPVNSAINNRLYISNLTPQGGEFTVNEKIILGNDLVYNNDPIKYANIINKAPIVIGSLNSLRILNGGFNFKTGDVLKIVHVDPSNNAIVSTGEDGILKVIMTERSQGSLTYYIQNGGIGYNKTANVFIYNNESDNAGYDASFDIGPLTYTRVVEYNTDLILDHLNYSNGTPITIDSQYYTFPDTLPNANLNSTLEDVLSFANGTFGTVSTLEKINPGNNYISAPYIFVRTNLDSRYLNDDGILTYSTTSNTVTGSNANFTTYFSGNDVIYLQANTSNSLTGEYHVIKEVVDSNTIVLYNAPNANSAANSNYKLATPLFPANFASYEPLMYVTDNSIASKDAIVSALPSNGNDTVSSVVAYNSGKNYIEDEIVTCYPFNGVDNPLIISGGTGYSNNEALLFSGGNPSSPGRGYIQTNGSGVITSTVITYTGSGYKSVPSLSVVSKNGNGAILQARILPADSYNVAVPVTGKVIKSGVGVAPGFWSTSRGFLDSDKYIQGPEFPTKYGDAAANSYFYQDFSYQIKAAATLSKYKDILYNTFHTAGSELFGQFYQIVTEKSVNKVLHEVFGFEYYHYSDTTLYTSDSTTLTVDSY
jgi:hypothetical protein